MKFFSKTSMIRFVNLIKLPLAIIAIAFSSCGFTNMQHHRGYVEATVVGVPVEYACRSRNTCGNGKYAVWRGEGGHASHTTKVQVDQYPFHREWNSGGNDNRCWSHPTNDGGWSDGNWCTTSNINTGTPCMWWESEK